MRPVKMQKRIAAWFSFELPESLELLLLIIFLMILMILSLSSQSCSRVENLLKIGVSFPHTSEPVYAIMKKAIQKKQKELKLEVVWKESGRPKDNMIPKERELQNVREMLEAGIKTLIYKPVDPNSTFAVLKDARMHNVGVIAIDDLPLNLPVDGYITVNETTVGRLEAEYIVDKIGARGKVVVLENPSRQIAREVSSGIYEVLDQYSDEVQVIPLVSKPDESEAFKLVSDAITKYAGNIQAVAACQSELAVGAVKAIQLMALDKDIISVGAGASKAACQMIISEKHDMEVDRMPYERAVMALDAAFAFAFSRKFEYDEIIKNGDAEVKVKYSPIRAITKNNVHLMNRMWPEMFK